ALAFVARPMFAGESAGGHGDAFRADRVPLLHFLFHFAVVPLGGIHVHLHRLRLAGHDEDHFVGIEVGGPDEHLAVLQIATGVFAVPELHPVTLLGADHFLVHHIHFHAAFLAVLVGGFIRGSLAHDGMKDIGDVGALDGGETELRGRPGHQCGRERGGEEKQGSAFHWSRSFCSCTERVCVAGICISSFWVCGQRGVSGPAALATKDASRTRRRRMTRVAGYLPWASLVLEWKSLPITQLPPSSARSYPCPYRYPWRRGARLVGCLSMFLCEFVCGSQLFPNRKWSASTFLNAACISRAVRGSGKATS